MSIKSRIQKKLRSGIDNVVQEVSERSLHVQYFHREVSDIYRRDDRQIQQFERRANRDERIYQAEVSERGRAFDATQSARLQRMMTPVGGTTLGRGSSNMRLSSTLGGGANFMSRKLGGGV